MFMVFVYSKGQTCSWNSNIFPMAKHSRSHHSMYIYWLLSYPFWKCLIILNHSSHLTTSSEKVPRIWVLLCHWIATYCGSLCKVTFIGWINGVQSNLNLLDDNNLLFRFLISDGGITSHSSTPKIRSTDPEYLWKVQSCHSDHEITSYPGLILRKEVSQDNESLLKQRMPINGSFIRPVSVRL